MVSNMLLRIETLFLVVSISLVTIFFYPSLISSVISHLPRIYNKQFPPELKQNIYLRSFYDFEEWFKDIKPYEFAGQSIIVHGIRKPHPPHRSPRLQRLKLVHEVQERRPWPRFSPANKPKIIENELSNVPPSSSIPTIKSKIRSYFNDKGNRSYLVKELYKGSYMWAHPELCQKNSREYGASDINLLIIVTSTPSNKDARTAIRRTWGNIAHIHGVVLAFLLGRPSPKKLDDVLKEDNLYGDLIVNNMRESHVNTTLKTISLLEWVDVHCARARTVLKTNDDVFINIPGLLDFIGEPNEVHKTKTIWGKVMKTIHPERHSQLSQYYLSSKEFPKDVLPDFVMGAAYLMSSDSVRPLFKMAAGLPFLRLDDVFVTGVLADAADVRRVHVDKFFKYNASHVKCNIRKVIAFEKVRYREMLKLWKTIQQCELVKMKKNYTTTTLK